MPADSAMTFPDEPDVLYAWTARSLHPVVVAYVLGVFLAFIVLAHFAFRSPAAVKSLALAAVTFVVPLLANVVNRIEYRLTAAGLEKRPLRSRNPRDFKEVFRWEQLDRVLPARHGFKYRKTLGAAGSWRRFWRAHLSDAHSGEFHVEARDRAAVLAIFTGRGFAP